MTYVAALTLFHTAISLVAIVAGAVACFGLFRGGRSRFWTDLFLITAVVTSLTGFVFPFKGTTPAQVVGIVALAILGAVLLAHYRFHVAGMWRWIYATGLVASLYLLVFVGVVQSFQKIAVLARLAPTQSEAPFVVAQAVTLLLFVVIGVAAARSYRPALLEASFRRGW